MFGLLNRGAKRSETAHLNAVRPVSTDPITEWYEVALCERDEETGEPAIKKIRRVLELEATFAEDDGVELSTEYTAIYRKVKIDEEEGLLYGAWSDTTGWKKTYTRLKPSDRFLQPVRSS